MPFLYQLVDGRLLPQWVDSTLILTEKTGKTVIAAVKTRKKKRFLKNAIKRFRNY
jgi:hypothetical protein